MKIIPSLFIAILGTANVLAQTGKTTFKGHITDESDLPVPGATIMILQPEDSTLVLFAASDTKGAFTMKNVAKGDYLLQVTFLGMAPHFQSVTAGLADETDLGKIVLKEASTILSEVKVTADYVPITIDKDTITYNADAFQVQPNAVVEDLLKKLPGIEVEPDGTIKAQGEQVRNVYVDGKEFFGSDPKIATRNLPAKALKKVKVYDKKSDIAEFTGVDDGEREKTIDLQLREEFRQGLFGTAQAGYGSDTRYNAKASINRFSKKTQVSFLGQLNNVNDQGFSFNDRMNFSGGMGGMMGGGGRGQSISINLSDMPGGSGGASGGLTQTGAGGLNFNWLKRKNFNVRTSYFYNGVANTLNQESFRQNQSANPFDTEKLTHSETKNKSHSFALNSDIEIDSFNQLRLNARLGFGNGTAVSADSLQNFVQSQLENKSQTRADNNSDNLSLNTSATYMRRLGYRGRNFSLSGTLAKGEQDTESFLEALTEYFTTGNAEALDQRQYLVSDDTRLEGQFTFTEPLRKRRFLELSYSYNKLDAAYNKRIFDVVNNVPELNDLLSADYNSVFAYHRPGATFRYSGEMHNVNAGVQYQVSELTGFVNQSEDEIRQDYKHFLPRFIWRWNMGNGRNLRFQYTTRVSQPSVTQLSPVIDNSDPLRIYIGNPDLNAEYSHNVSLNFHLFSQFSSTSFFASVGGTVTNDRIITARNIDEQFREVSTPINIDRENRVNMNLSFGRPLKLIHSRVNLNTNLSYTNTQNVINNGLLDVNRWSRTAGITITNMNSNVLEYNLGGRWTFTDNYYPTGEALDQHTVFHTYFADATLTLWKKWRLQAGYTFNLYTSDRFADNQSFPLMQMSISRMVLPGDKGQIRFSVFDVLDENRGLSRTANINYLEELRSNSIGRYAMLSFIYTIQGGGGTPMGGIRVIEHRG